MIKKLKLMSIRISQLVTGGANHLRDSERFDIVTIIPTGASIFVIICESTDFWFGGTCISAFPCNGRDVFRVVIKNPLRPHGSPPKINPVAILPSLFPIDRP